MTGEITVVVFDGVPKIVEAPAEARISWALLAEAGPPWHLDFADGLITLCGTVVYRIVGAERQWAVVDLVADNR